MKHLFYMAISMIKQAVRVNRRRYVYVTNVVCSSPRRTFRSRI
ncbi:MAG TPA: hypothetical protein VFU15_01590 [Bacteroidia bacterium]|nr:hypothetical protein [Bacteroidia bacterium]